MDGDGRRRRRYCLTQVHKGQLTGGRAVCVPGKLYQIAGDLVIVVIANWAQTDPRLSTFKSEPTHKIARS